MSVADASDALWEMTAAGDARFRIGDVCRRYGEAGRLLLSRGYLAPADNPRTVICSDCGEPHEADLKLGPEGWRYACLTSGAWIAAGEEAVSAVRFAPEVLLMRVAAALSTKGRVRARVPGAFWVLGEATTERVRWTAMLAHCPDAATLDAVVAVLPTVSTLPGLVLTTTGLGRLVGPVASHRFTQLSRHVRLNRCGDIVVDDGSLLAALGRPRRGERSPGRPSAKGAIKALVFGLSDAEAVVPAAALVDRIRAGLPTDAPAIKDDTMARHISTALKARWKNRKTGRV